MTSKHFDGIVGLKATNTMAQRPRMSIDIDPDLLYRLRIIAAKERMSLTRLVIQTLLEKYPEAKTEEEA